MKRHYLLADYLTQFARLRRLAKILIHSRYNLDIESIANIGHWENSTFKVVARDRDGKRGKFLFRLHRPGYNNKTSIQTELNWLSLLRANDISVPRSVATVEKKDICDGSVIDAPGRRDGVLFHWMNGRIGQNLSASEYKELGEILGKLHTVTPLNKSLGYRRNYNDPFYQENFAKLEAWLGKETFARIFSVYNKANDQFAKSHDGLPLRLIHCDLHSGNILKTAKGLSIIDFDDCVYGPIEMDLCFSFWRWLKIDRPDERQAFLAGYATTAEVPQQIESSMLQMIVRRAFWTMNWHVDRDDNIRMVRDRPGFMKYFVGVVESLSEKLKS